MRWLLAVAAVIPLVALSGCVDAGADPFGVRDCPTSGSTTVQREYELLLPKGTPEPMVEAAGGHARLTVDALEGQWVSATAVWQVTSGRAQAVLEGPDGGSSTRTPNAYTWSGQVAAGTYTLEVVGDPVAMGNVVILSLTASGCPTTNAA